MYEVVPALAPQVAALRGEELAMIAHNGRIVLDENGVPGQGAKDSIAEVVEMLNSNNG